MSKVEIRLPYSEYPDTPLVCPEESLTKQSFAQECDFNAVLSQWERTGVIEHIDARTPQYADVSELVDYQQALNIVSAAQDSFLALPSSIRERFDNNPAGLIHFLNDPANRAEAESLGLLSSSVDKAERSQKAGVALSTEPPQEASK